MIYCDFGGGGGCGAGVVGFVTFGCTTTGLVPEGAEGGSTKITLPDEARLT